MATVTTSVRMSKETKQRLKLLSAKIGKSQAELIDKYVKEGLKIDEDKLNAEKTSYNIEEIKNILMEDVEEDKQKGIINNKKSLKDIAGIIELDYSTDSVQLKKED